MVSQEHKVECDFPKLQVRDSACRKLDPPSLTPRFQQERGSFSPECSASISIPNRDEPCPGNSLENDKNIFSDTLLPQPRLYSTGVYSSPNASYDTSLSLSIFSAKNVLSCLLFTLTHPSKPGLVTPFSRKALYSPSASPVNLGHSPFAALTTPYR